MVEMNLERRVLVVDDDPVFVKTTRVILESHGYQVDSAKNGDEALAKMGQQRPDLVLLDVIMNWPLEGVYVSQEMLARKEFRGIPIIMVTSIVDSEYRGLFPQDQYLHIDAWLNKPCSPSKLLDEVERTLLRYQRVRQSGVTAQSAGG